MRRPFLLFRVDFDIPYNPRQRLATFAVPLVRKVVKQRHEFVLSERAGTARSRIVGMLLVEDLALFARICLQSFRGFVLGVSVIRHFRCGFVCGLQFALAVPAVAGAVFVPKGITHGAHRAPESAVVGTGVRGCGRQPFEVGQLELPPPRGKVRPVNRRVVLRLEPCAVAVAGIRNASVSSPPCLWTRTKFLK